MRGKIDIIYSKYSTLWFKTLSLTVGMLKPITLYMLAHVFLRLFFV